MYIKYTIKKKIKIIRVNFFLNFCLFHNNINNNNNNDGHCLSDFYL